jgi:hypothetical protein
VSLSDGPPSELVGRDWALRAARRDAALNADFEQRRRDETWSAAGEPGARVEALRAHVADSFASVFPAWHEGRAAAGKLASCGRHRRRAVERELTTLTELPTFNLGQQAARVMVENDAEGLRSLQETVRRASDLVQRDDPRQAEEARHVLAWIAGALDVLWEHAHAAAVAAVLERAEARLRLLIVDSLGAARDRAVRYRPGHRAPPRDPTPALRVIRPHAPPVRRGESTAA